MPYRGFSGAGFAGNHLSTTLLEQLRPAADNAGRTATVGNPATSAAWYFSDGNSWKAVAFSVLNTLYANYEGMTHTGTTAETILYSVLIPGGTIVAPASLEHYLRFQLTTTSDAGTRAVRTYLNTVNSLSGATLMGDMFHTTVSVTYSYLRPGDPIIFPTSTSQLGWPRGNGPNSLNSLAADRTGTLDTAADMYFIVSATLSNAADSLAVRGVRLMLNGET